MSNDDLILSSSDIKSLKGIRFAEGNMHCMFTKFEEVVQFIISSDIAFLIITETWLTDVMPDNFISVAGYNMFCLDGNLNLGRTWGGAY